MLEFNKNPAVGAPELTDDQIYYAWIHRDCMDAIRAGDMRAQFISAVRSLQLKPPSPDMLAASRRMLAALDAHDTLHVADGDDCARMFEFGQSVDALRAAIAKADAGSACGMSARDNGGPSFPVSTGDPVIGHQDGASTSQFPDMTLRDYFAAAALRRIISGLYAGTYEYDSHKERAKFAYEQADAMMLERAK